MASNNVPAYPMMFDPSQFNNSFSNYNGAALPWPSSYVGAPTDALGNPISSYQAPQPVFTPGPVGTTLNSGPTYGLQPRDLAGPSALNPSGNLAFGMGEWGGMMSPQARELYANQQFAPPGSPRGTTYANSQPAASGGSWSTPNNSAAYLSALANPNRVVTPGGPVQPAAYQPNTGSAIDAILAQLQAAGGQGQAAPPGVGGGSAGLSMGSNVGFLNALAALRSGAAPSAGSGTGTK